MDNAFVPSCFPISNASDGGRSSIAIGGSILTRNLHSPGMHPPDGPFPFGFPGGNPGSDFESILGEAPWFKSNLPRYDRWESVSLLAGLLTKPACLANTVRLEAMTHLCVALARGQMAPRRDDLIIWFNRHFWNTNLRLMEDPPEDVFVSNVVDETGNHRIFEGIWEENAYWLQCLISAVRKLPDRPEYAAMRRSMRALLDFSEAVVDRNEIDRNTEGGGEDKERIPFPDRDELADLAANVVFTNDELLSLGIDPDHLSPFIWSDFDNPSILTSENDDSPLQRRPILKRNDAYLLALPSAVSIAIRRYVLETVNIAGDLTLLDQFICIGQANEATEEGISSLDGSSLKIEDVPAGEARFPVSITLCPFKFDTDKFGVLCLLNPPLKDALQLGFMDFAKLDAWENVETTIRRITEAVTAIPGFRSGLCVFAVGGLGARFAVPIIELPEPWLTVSYSVPKLLTLARAEDVDFLMIWRLAAQEAKARAQGIEFINPNGDFNQIANWRAAKFTLIPDDIPTNDGRPTFIHPPVNGLLELRLEARRRADIHAAIRNNPSRWIMVERKDPHSPFRRSRERPLYAVRHLAKKGELVAVVDLPSTSWWISCDARPKTTWQLSLVYQLWDCMSHWLAPVAEALAKKYSVERLVAEFTIAFPGIENWQRIGASEPDAADISLGWRFIGDRRIELRVTEEFMRTFGQPANKAEREIVAALLVAGASAIGESLPPEEAASLRNSIIPIGDARHFHLTSGNDASFAAEPGPVHSYWVRPEVFAEGIQNLGYAVAPELLGKRTDDPTEVRRLARSAVESIRTTMGKKLAPLSLSAVVRRCLDVLNTLHRDARVWEMSAAALLAIYRDREELLAEAHRQESKRAGANSAARTLIETALYSCHGGTEDISDSTLDELLALAQILIQVANYDPPGADKFPPGSVSISKSGAFYIKNEFLDKLRNDYHRGGFEEGFYGSANSYDRHYRNEAGASLPDDFDQFGVVLSSELGANPEQAFRVAEALNRIGGERRESVLKMRRSEFESLLVTEGEIAAEKASILFDSLRIYPRAEWNQDLPEGCEPIDVYPWRFMRKFSLLRRPIVQLEHGADPELLVSPVLVRDALRYFISNSYDGIFPPDFFRTPEMRSFQDKAIARRSTKFVRLIAEIMTKAGFRAEVDVPMPKLGAAAELGDVDVLAWRNDKNPAVWILECKAMRNARSTADVLSQLRQFSGDAGDLLSKHLRRAKWLDSNRAGLTKLTGLNDFTLTGAVVTSHLVPMQFLPTADTQFGWFLDAESFKKRFPAI